MNDPNNVPCLNNRCVAGETDRFDTNLAQAVELHKIFDHFKYKKVCT